MKPSCRMVSEAKPSPEMVSKMKLFLGLVSVVKPTQGAISLVSPMKYRNHPRGILMKLPPEVVSGNPFGGGVSGHTGVLLLSDFVRTSITEVQ